MRALAVRSLALLTMQAGVALADEELPPERGVQIGLRSGIALPFGKLDAKSDNLSNLVSVQIPIWVDVGYRVIPEVTVGGYAQLGFIIHGNDCSDCATRDWRFGVMGRYTYRPREDVHPWVGVGTGYEIFTRDFADTGFGGGRTTSRGWEFANLQLGVDKRYPHHTTLGAFISLSFDRITTETVTTGGVGQDVPDLATSMHEWLFFGLRGSVDL